MSRSGSKVETNPIRVRGWWDYETKDLWNMEIDSNSFAAMGMTVENIAHTIGAAIVTNFEPNTLFEFHVRNRQHGNLVLCALDGRDGVKMRISADRDTYEDFLPQAFAQAAEYLGWIPILETI